MKIQKIILSVVLASSMLLACKTETKKIFMAIATNKRHTPTIKLINHYNWQDYFITIECSDDRSFIRNKDDMIQDILNKDKEYYNDLSNYFRSPHIWKKTNKGFELRKKV